MIEICLCALSIILLSFWYFKHQIPQKQKIKFDLLQDRNIKI